MPENYILLYLSILPVISENIVAKKDLNNEKKIFLEIQNELDDKNCTHIKYKSQSHAPRLMRDASLNIISFFTEN